jgi:hypothetical protein
MNEYERYGEYAEPNIESSSRVNAAPAVTFLLIGMGIGAAVALLLTPMRGRELRNAIGQGCRTAFDGISEQTRSLRDHGSNLLGFNRRRPASGEYERGARS